MKLRKSKGLSEEIIKTPASSDNSFTPKLTLVHNSKIALKSEGNYFNQDKVYLTHKNVVIFI